MAHFAARFCFGLAIQVQFCRRVGQNCLPVVNVVTQQVFHPGFGMMARIAKRQITDSPDKLFELAGDTGINRPVPGIMRARGDLIDQNAAIGGDTYFFSSIFFNASYCSKH